MIKFSNAITKKLRQYYAKDIDGEYQLEVQV